tara:strand:- start:11701 stop:12144 length:444 start_codon:yes stop_codon:yes gene_type:complete
MDPITTIALQKFNQGKNASHFKADLDAGTYPVEVTCTLLGVVRRGKAGVTKRRNDSGSAHIVRYLLDRLTPSQYTALLDNLTDIRKGRFEHADHGWFDHRIEQIMPYREIPRTGSTQFDGELIIEDYDTTTTAIPETTRGLRVITQG